MANNYIIVKDAFGIDQKLITTETANGVHLPSYSIPANSSPDIGSVSDSKYTGSGNSSIIGIGKGTFDVTANVAAQVANTTVHVANTAAQVANVASKLPLSVGTKPAANSFAITLSTENVTLLASILAGVNPVSATAVTGSINLTGNSLTFTPSPLKPFNLVFSGSWVGSITVERQFGGAGAWFTCTYLGEPVTFTTNASEVLEESEANVSYRLQFTRTSGTLDYRFSQ